MNNAPILIVQMQRMGDLALSFPLLWQLAELFPDHPLWVVGERLFFEPLMPLSPSATYFDYADAPALHGLSFHAVINLSHRPQATLLAGRVRSDALFGPYLDADNRLLIRGDWQLYRASLTHNNRYNLFHWSDLNALDIIPERLMARAAWPFVRPLPACGRKRGENGRGVAAARPKNGAHIGLFLGASEAEKHPDAEFWAILTQCLLRAGHKPVLLGGTAEQPLGTAVANTLKAHSLNLCGYFSINALARFIEGLDLLVVPDTGPMHIAAWTGTPVLNLSMGPVNPWETGPFSPGHHIARATLDCIGCWRCTKEKTVCKEELTAGKVAILINAILHGESGNAAALSRKIQGLELLRTNRGPYGLYALDTVFCSLPLRRKAGEPDCGHGNTGGAASSKAMEDIYARHALSSFWKAWFGVLFGRFTAQEDLAAWITLRQEHPQAAEQLRGSAAALASDLAKAMRGNLSSLLEVSDLWKHAPPCLHPLSGYIHMYVQNAMGSRTALLHVLSLLEKIAALPG